MKKLFGRWKIIKEEKTKGGRAGFLCVCSCGNSRVVCKDHLKSGRSTSCGCVRNEKSSARMKKVNLTHGMARTPTHISWVSMKQRCNNQNSPSFFRYGGRQIKVCKRWVSFKNFFEDMGKRPKGTSLDRIDNNGNYNKNNCRWTNRFVQTNNRRTNKLITFKNTTHTLAEWERLKGFRSGLIASRLLRGWSEERSLSPVIDNK